MPSPGAAAIEAATRSGFRQALEQAAEQLRTQAKAWRDEAQKAASSAGLLERYKARQRLAEVERWCALLEQIAGLWSAKAQSELVAEHRAMAEAQRAPAVERGVLERLLGRR